MRHRLFVHLIWTTRERQSLIDARVARFLSEFLRDVASQERARVMAIGMVRTHVHMLVRVHPQTSLTRLVQRLKGGSATVATKLPPRRAIPLEPPRYAGPEATTSTPSATAPSTSFETTSSHSPPTTPTKPSTTDPV
jgi:REP element-mobilizing transposase RayT